MSASFSTGLNVTGSNTLNSREIASQPNSNHAIHSNRKCGFICHTVNPASCLINKLFLRPPNFIFLMLNQNSYLFRPFFAVMEGIVHLDFPKEKLQSGIDAVTFLAETTIFPSKGEARKMIQNGCLLNLPISFNSLDSFFFNEVNGNTRNRDQTPV
jgi:hypothetical protein